MHDFESLWTDDDRETSISHKKNLTDRQMMIAEVMQEISLLKGMDQAFRISCRYLNLTGQFLNVVRLWRISTLVPQVYHLRELVVSVKAILINKRMLLYIPQNWYQTRKHTRKTLTVVMSVT